MKIYGITTCGTVKKARAWLAAQGADVPYHDFRKDGLDGELLDRWFSLASWETLLNRKGTTWRKLGDDEKAAVTDAVSAKAAMLAHPNIIKRPVLDTGSAVVVGFDEARYQEIFQP